MSLEIDVLRALLRLARRRMPPTLEQILVRVGGDDAEVRRVLRSLGRKGLVHQTATSFRLSMAGLAVAVACAERRRSVARPERDSSIRLAVRRRAA